MQRILTPLIIAIVATQAFVSLARPPLVRATVVASWPFLNYPMYKRSYLEGDRISQVFLLAVKNDSTELQLSRHDLGVTEWQYAKFINAVCANDRSYADPFIAATKVLTHSDLQSLIVVDRGFILTANGPETAPEMELGRYAIWDPTDRI